MRCQFCGWENPQGKTNCEKCNKPLMDAAFVSGHEAVPPASERHSRPTDRQAASLFNPKATVRESTSECKTENQNQDVCPECGYPLENGTCASCGFSAVQAADKPASNAGMAVDMRKTIRPQRKGDKERQFTLTPISEETGLPEGKPLVFEGDEVCLNRENTDPKNLTITSAHQALIRCEQGKWNMEDKSELKTTFVQASRPIELQKGDLILLGNQLYRFDV